MIDGAVQFYDFNFNIGTSILKDPATATTTNFGNVLEEKIKEATVSDTKRTDKGTKVKENKEKKPTLGELPDISKLLNDPKDCQSNGVRSAYSILEKLKDKSSNQEESFGNNTKNPDHSPNVVGHPLVDRLNQDSGQKASRSKILSLWERVAPTVSEDSFRKSVRIDIPLLNDVRTLILRMNSDRSISASLLGSEAMADLIRQNKDKLEKNLKDHNLTLREFRTYHSELEFNNESGSKKQKRKPAKAKTFAVDIL